jgi:hypothetical protein
MSSGLTPAWPSRSAQPNLVRLLRLELASDSKKGGNSTKSGNPQEESENGADESAALNTEEQRATEALAE